MELTGAVLVFLAQLMCCVLIRHKWMKYLPTLLCMAGISVTVLNASMGEMNPQLLVEQTKLTLMGAFAAVLYHAVMIIWKRMKGGK